VSQLVGTSLNGRYRLDARIAAGGMSMVYRAFDETLERQVAVKLMNREVASDSDQLERFRREARAVAQLSHPHIVGVIDAGDDGDPDHPRPYIVFEYVDGETLKERILRLGRLPIGEAIAYAIEIARALGAAHGRHIVHRDVKPQNVLLDSEGSAKVTDFGIARTLEEDGLTVDGRVLGTTDYVSPEQALGRPVTGRSDIYSLGVVLYEMLTGEVPYRGDSQVAVAMKHVRDPFPDVQVLRPEVSAALAAVIETATAKQMEDRYADDAEMIADLEEVLALETVRHGTAPGGQATAMLRTLPEASRRRLGLRHRRPMLVLGLLVAVAALIGAAVILALGAGHPAPRRAAVPATRPASTRIALCASCAHDYNPDPLSGPPTQNPAEDGLAIDGNPKTAWTTQIYYDDTLGKPGVGLYVDASRLVAASTLSLTTSTPGFAATIYGRVNPPQATAFDVGPSGWVKLAQLPDVRPSQQISLSTGGARYRYYLVWITALGRHDTVAINEIGLFG
jgi:hypothetical protein